MKVLHAYAMLSSGLRHMLPSRTSCGWSGEQYYRIVLPGSDSVVMSFGAEAVPGPVMTPGDPDYLVMVHDGRIMTGGGTDGQ